MSVIKRVLQIKEGELALVILLGVMLFLNAVSLELTQIVGTSGFLSQVGALGLLFVVMIGMIIVVSLSTVQALVIDRVNRVRALRLLCLILALLHMLLRVSFELPIANWIPYAILIVINDAQWFFFPVVFWVLANDLLSIAQAKRLFPVLIGVGFLGQILGGSIGVSAPTVLGIVPRDLLIINVMIFLGIFALAVVRLRNALCEPTGKKQSLRQTFNEGWGFIRDVPSFRFLAAGTMALSVAMLVIRHFFHEQLNARISDPLELQAYYGSYRVVLMSSILIVTLFLTSRITQRVGLKNQFLIYPIFITGTIVVLLFAPVLAVVTVGIIGAWLNYYTVYQSARRAYQGLIPVERRGRVSLLLDTYLPAIGSVLGVLLIFAAVSLSEVILGGSQPLYLGVGVVAAGFGIWSMLQMRAHYETSLLNWRMKRRTHRSSVLDNLEF